FQAIMTAICALSAQTYGAEIKLHLIGNDEQLIRLNLLLLHPVRHSLTAEIHIRARLQEDQGSALVANFSDTARSFDLPRPTKGIGKHIDNFEPDIVPCVCIFSSDIAKTGD